MDDKQIQAIADRVIEALHQLAPGEPPWWAPWAAFGSYVALLAAGVAFVVGMKSLKHQKDALDAQREASENALEQQRTALDTQREASEKALSQKQRADDRAEWWRRTQWAIESAASKDEKLNAAGSAMIPLMGKGELVSDEDRDLLDTIWKVDPASADEESAEEFEKRLDAFDELDPDLLLDDSPETGENGNTKEVEDAED